VNTKFIGLQIDNQLEEPYWWNDGARYAIRLMVHISNITTLKSVYYAYFHSVIKIGIMG
jgi:hypothetical protein